MSLTIYPIRTKDEVILDLIKTKNEQSLLKFKENKLIDELLEIDGGLNGHGNDWT